ncbi:unnamed protein product, partial [Discosporangium mesarthrocarpum]
LRESGKPEGVHVWSVTESRGDISTYDASCAFGGCMARWEGGEAVRTMPIFPLLMPECNASQTSRQSPVCTLYYVGALQSKRERETPPNHCTQKRKRKNDVHSFFCSCFSCFCFCFFNSFCCLWLWPGGGRVIPLAATMHGSNNASQGLGEVLTTYRLNASAAAAERNVIYGGEVKDEKQAVVAGKAEGEAAGEDRDQVKEGEGKNASTTNAAVAATSAA